MDETSNAKLEQDIEDYLVEHRLSEMFKELMETVLLARPDNPIDFIYHYLPQKYPSKIKLSTGNPRRVSGVLNHLPSLGGDDGNDDDSVDGQNMASPVHFSPKTIKSRKSGISGESMDPEKLKAQIQNVTSIEKSALVSQTLLNVVGKSPLLKALDDDQKELIVRAFEGPMLVEPGVNIIRQGDVGDVFYLIEEGNVDVFVKKDNENVKVHSYTSGDAFGELALMYNAPRAATCRTVSLCKFWTLDRTSFKCIVVAAAMQKREMFVAFLQSVPILKTLTELEIMTLADAMIEEKYESGQLICKQGDEGRYFYIIREGEASCTIEDKSGQVKLVASLGSGNYFGEVALLTSKPRQATVQAKGVLRVLAVDRATFTRVLGSIEDILMRNMEEYNKFAAQAI